MKKQNIQTVPQIKKAGTFMNFAMGITVSVMLSTHGVISSGHFTVKNWILSMIISCILAICIGFFLPVRQAREKATSNIKGPLKFIVGNIITNLFYVSIITTINTTLMITLARHAMEIQNVPLPGISAILPHSLLSSFILSYIVTMILEPLYLRIAFKKFGINPKANSKSE